MNFQFWDPAALANMFNSNNRAGTFSAHVPAYFQRPAKIVKTGSRNNSPRSSGRRRMTTTGHFPVRTRSVVDPQRTTVPYYPQQQQSSTRPISWHPNMMDDISHSQMLYQPMMDNYNITPYGTTAINGLVTPLSYPIVDEPQIQELITPLEELSANDSNSHYGNEQAFSNPQYWMSQQTPKDVQYDFGNGYIYPDVNYQSWYANSQQQIHNIPTAPASPNYIPMPNFGEPLSIPTLEPETEKEELVGMGLYDSPAEVQTSSLLLGGDIGAAKRKSLKLEDAFEPSPSSDEDEEEEYAEDDDDVPRNNHADAGITSAVDAVTMPSAEYTHIMNNYPLMVNQWPVDDQSSYGWV